MTTLSGTIGGRDLQFEREFLRQAQTQAGLSSTGFSQKVQDRIMRMEREKGPDSYLKLGPHRLIAECAEEGLDLGGWGVLTALALDRVEDQETAFQIRLLLIEIAAHGARVDYLCNEALRLAEDLR